MVFTEPFEWTSAILYPPSYFLQNANLAQEKSTQSNIILLSGTHLYIRISIRNIYHSDCWKLKLNKNHKMFFLVLFPFSLSFALFTIAHTYTTQSYTYIFTTEGKCFSVPLPCARKWFSLPQKIRSIKTKNETTITILNLNVK